MFILNTLKFNHAASLSAPKHTQLQKTFPDSEAKKQIQRKPVRERNSHGNK